MRHGFLKMNPNRTGSAGGFKKSPSGAHHEVGIVARQSGVAAGEGNPVCAPRRAAGCRFYFRGTFEWRSWVDLVNRQGIRQSQRNHERLQFMETVGAFSEN